MNVVRTEVVVVGAGPAGAATAFHLARRGREVILVDRREFPRDKSCGDGLTPPAVRLLEEMGVADRLHAFAVRGARFVVSGRGHRDFLYPDDAAANGLVVPRIILDDAIRRRALEMGAVPLTGTVSRLCGRGSRCVGVELRERNLRISARVVVIAEGSSGTLARQAGLREPEAERPGFAIRGYYDGVDELSDLLEIHLPLLAASQRQVLPSYGWVFPLGPGRANIGVGVFDSNGQSNVRRLMESFVTRLRRDERFGRMDLTGRWIGAPLRFDFNPNSCSGPGVLVVGDAAGMVSPFTGEGISYALESAALAAEVIDRNSASQDKVDLSEYSLLLEHRYLGYFEAGRRAARRHALVWRVLESTFASERPAFRLVRRAALLPEGTGELRASRVLEDVRSVLAPQSIDVRTDLLEVLDLVVSSVRQEWPFLLRMTTAGKRDPGVPFRPALVTLLAARLVGAATRPSIRVAAAVELGYLAGIALESVEPHADRRIHWGNTFAISVGDLLLAHSYRLAAGEGPELVTRLATAVETASQARLCRVEQRGKLNVDPADYLNVLTLEAEALFQLASEAAAVSLTGTPGPAVGALAGYGPELGLAYLLASEARELHDVTEERALTTQLLEGRHTLAVVLALKRSDLAATRLRDLLRTAREHQDSAAALEAVRILRRGTGVEATLALARNHAARACAALESCPPSAERTSLRALARWAASAKR